MIISKMHFDLKQKRTKKNQHQKQKKNNLMQNSKAREGGVCGEDQGALQFSSCHHMDKRIKEFNAYILIENRKGQRKKTSKAEENGIRKRSHA